MGNRLKSGQAPRALDERSRGTLCRCIDDWIRPRWRRILLALLFTAGLAATTGGYPLIIKHSFDSLMKGDSQVLPWVLAAIVVVTTARSAFLYLHQVTGARSSRAWSRYPEGGLRHSSMRTMRA